jgi:thiamine-phosphate pyrophosphorylase
VIRYCITDRRLIGVEQALASGVDFLQIREKDFSARDLLALIRAVLALPNPRATKILLNSRMDVALTANLAGLHLPAKSIPPDDFRKIAPPEFVIGVSCHSIDEVRDAESHGADYVLFGPVFAPISKSTDLAPCGLVLLSQAARAVRIPVIALGGITNANASACEQAGAAGVAGISLFQRD